MLLDDGDEDAAALWTTPVPERAERDEGPDGPELEYASRTDVLLLLETSVDNLTAAAKAAGEAAQDNGYLLRKPALHLACILYKL